MSIDSVVLSEDRQLELNRIAQSRSLPAGYVFRARLILMLAEGASFSTIEQRLGTTAPTISRWKQRFLASGMDGLDTNHPGQSASVLTPKLQPGFSQLPARSRRTVPLTGIVASLPQHWASARTLCIGCGKMPA
jgi:hypothetical protein